MNEPVPLSVVAIDGAARHPADNWPRRNPARPLVGFAPAPVA